MRNVHTLSLFMFVLLSASCSSTSTAPGSSASGSSTSSSSGTGAAPSTSTSSSSGTGGAPSTSASSSSSSASSNGGDGGPCGAIYGTVGCCLDNTAYYCESTAEGLTVMPCGDAGICTWKAEDSYYDCVTVTVPADAGPDAQPPGPQADPSGMFPITCM
jgi:hypothetical protein